jgi:hypothetical protein
MANFFANVRRLERVNPWWRHRYADVRSEHWNEVKDGNPALWNLFVGHYSYRPRRRFNPRFLRLTVGPGQKLLLLTSNERAGIAFRKFIDDSGQQGVCCAWFRNTGGVGCLSSQLIHEGATIAQRRWPGQRLYTFVDAGKVRSANPGYCFKMAGWRSAGRTAGGLHILEKTI